MIAGGYTTDAVMIKVLVLIGRRFVLPKYLRGKVLCCLYSAHQVMDGMKAHANDSVFWPGMNASIWNFKANCLVCENIAPSQHQEPITITPSPDWSFQQIPLLWWAHCIPHLPRWTHLLPYFVPSKTRSCHHFQVNVHLSETIPHIWYPRQTQPTFYF